jgi:hypothetical protein
VIKKIPLRFKMLGPALLGPALLSPALLGPALTLVATPVQARVVDRVVAVVNEGIITWSELEDVARPILAQVGEVSDPVLREQTRDRQLRRRSLECPRARLPAAPQPRRQLHRQQHPRLHRRHPRHPG